MYDSYLVEHWFSYFDATVILKKIQLKWIFWIGDERYEMKKENDFLLNKLSDYFYVIK